MNSIDLPVVAISASLLISVAAYLVLSRREGSHVNILTPYFMTAIPAFYLLPLVYLSLFGAESTANSHFWVYTAIAVETLAFVCGYARTGQKVVGLPGFSSYSNFGLGSFLCLTAGTLLYVPVLIEFRE